MFSNRDARVKLANMGGIISSSPELLGAAQMYAEGGNASAPEVEQYVAVIPGVNESRPVRMRADTLARLQEIAPGVMAKSFVMDSAMAVQNGIDVMNLRPADAFVERQLSEQMPESVAPASDSQSAGYRPPNIGATELNTPAIRTALAELSNPDQGVSGVLSNISRETLEPPINLPGILALAQMTDDEKNTLFQNREDSMFSNVSPSSLSYGKRLLETLIPASRLVTSADSSENPVSTESGLERFERQNIEENPVSAAAKRAEAAELYSKGQRIRNRVVDEGVKAVNDLDVLSGRGVDLGLAASLLGNKFAKTGAGVLNLPMGSMEYLQDRKETFDERKARLGGDGDVRLSNLFSKGDPGPSIQDQIRDASLAADARGSGGDTLAMTPTESEILIQARRADAPVTATGIGPGPNSVPTSASMGAPRSSDLAAPNVAALNLGAGMGDPAQRPLLRDPRLEAEQDEVFKARLEQADRDNTFSKNNPVYSREEIDAANPTLEANQELFEKIPAGRPQEGLPVTGPVLEFTESNPLLVDPRLSIPTGKDASGGTMPVAPPVADDAKQSIQGNPKQEYVPIPEDVETYATGEAVPFNIFDGPDGVGNDRGPKPSTEERKMKEALFVAPEKEPTRKEKITRANEVTNNTLGPDGLKRQVDSVTEELKMNPTVNPNTITSKAVLDSAGIDTKNMTTKERILAQKKLLSDLLGRTDADKKEEFWMNMAMMGFAIAAGESPNAIQNISNGLLTGVASIQKGKAADRKRDDDLTLAAFQNILSEDAATTKFNRQVILADKRAGAKSAFPTVDRLWSTVYKANMDSYREAVEDERMSRDEAHRRSSEAASQISPDSQFAKNSASVTDSQEAAIAAARAAAHEAANAAALAAGQKEYKVPGDPNSYKTQEV
jgi:hypothetical protein